MVFFLGLPPSVEHAVWAAREEAAAQASSSGELRVEWRVQRYEADASKASFTGGVKAVYDLTTVTSDDLDLDYANKTGRARGHVRVQDPEGTLDADELEFNWVDRTGVAHNVSMVADGVRVKVSQVRIEKNRWVFDRLWATPSKRQTPDVAFSSRRVALQPGRSGTTSGSTLSLWGLRLPEIPSMTFSLDRRVDGFRIPAISYRQGSGVGVAWRSGFLLGEQASLGGSVGVFPNVLPSTAISLAWSAIPAGRSIARIDPGNDLSERFVESAIENIVARQPSAEDDHFRQRRATVAIVSAWNQPTYGRRKDFDGVSKRWELATEVGGPVGKGFGGLGQVRLQSLRLDQNDPFRTRVLGSATLHSGARRISEHLTGRVRLDGLAVSGGGSDSYSWLRAGASAEWHPIREFRATAGVGIAKEWGTPAFEIDPLYANRSFNLRGDLMLGSIKASSLVKYDMQRRRWYDTEWSFSIVADSLEPYLTTRQFPKTYQIGVRFRFDALRDRLTSRVQKRREPVPESQNPDAAGGQRPD